MYDIDENILLCDLSFALYDVRSGSVETFDPLSEKKITYGSLSRGDAEYAATGLYSEIDYYARDINHKNSSPLKTALGIEVVYQGGSYKRTELTGVRTIIRELTIRHTSAVTEADAFDQIDINGRPDLLVRRKDDPTDFHFVEVKKPHERLHKNQVDWITRFDFLPVQIAKVFESSEARDAYVSDYSLNDILSNIRRESKIDERPELPADEIADRISTVDVGDEIYFNKWKSPYLVLETGVTSSGSGEDITGVKVRSSKGNEFVLSEKGDWYRDGHFRRDLWWVEVDSK